MRKLRNHLVGVEQGQASLFSHFESGGEMWTGEGSRCCCVRVTFSEAFRSAPSVSVTIAMIDMDQRTNHRTDITAENITQSGFEIVFKTWGDTRIARVRAGWFAIGEARSNDEWDLD